MGGMSKRTIILVVLAVVLFLAALGSLFFEKEAAVDELQKYLNGDPVDEKIETDEQPEASDGQPND